MTTFPPTATTWLLLDCDTKRKQQQRRRPMIQPCMQPLLPLLLLLQLLVVQVLLTRTTVMGQTVAPTTTTSTTTTTTTATTAVQSANSTANASTFHLRINCGASSRIPIVMHPTESWTKDIYALSGALSNRCHRRNGTNTAPNTTTTTTTTTSSSIYCSSRYFRTAFGTQPLRYEIPVPYNNAPYMIRLHFNDMHHNMIGERVFNVLIENKIVLNTFDIIRDAPGKNVPMIVSVPTAVTVTDSTVTIDFVEIVGDPQINGIEVLYVGDGNVPISSPVVEKVPIKVPVKVPIQAPLLLPTKRPTTTPVVATVPTKVPVKRPIPAPITIGTSKGPTAAPVVTVPVNVPMKLPIHAPTTIQTTKIPTTAPVVTVPVIIPTKTPTKDVPNVPITTPIAIVPSQPLSPTAATILPRIVPTRRTKFPTKMPSIAPTTQVQVDAVPIRVPVPTTTTNGTKLPFNNNAPIIKTPVRIPVRPPVPTVAVTGNIVHRINCGSTKQIIVSPNNIVWTPDQYVSTGVSYNTCGNTTTISSIYCTSRYFRTTDVVPHRYDLPVPVSNRTYQVRLHFAEQYHKRVKARVFDVYVEGALVIDDLDIIAIPGGNVSYYVTALPFVSDGSITIDLVRVKDNPQINGIEVFDDGRPLPTPVAAPRRLPTATTAPLSVPTVRKPTTILPPKSAPTVVSSNTTFRDIVINCGGPRYLEQSGVRYWSADSYFSGGSTYSITNIQVLDTVDDSIYQSERVGVFSYNIAIPVGTYEINIHLAELAFTSSKKRMFNLTIESQVFDLVDIFTLANGAAKAATIGATVVVDDGFASISFAKVVGEPKINGIEIKRSIPHIAHSVSNGPYFAVDTSNVGFATVNVDGSESHTHGADLALTEWIWKEGAQTLGTGEITSFNLSVGTHDVTLTVVDNGNFEATDATTVTVNPSGFPDIKTLSPSSGSIVGGELVTIRGTGFTYLAADIIVYFGIQQLTGSAILVVNSTAITVSTPKIPIGVPVLVSVQTPLGRSKDATYTYVSSTRISFATTKLLDYTQPTSAAFGPDGKLYVGSVKGILAKMTLNDNFTSFVNVVSAQVLPGRAILGITFDPSDSGNSIPYVYVSSSVLFHGETNSSSGMAISGKISRIGGANLDSVEDIITGLPVCDNDHAINQIQFGNNGELYVNIGSNTNGGMPGPLSGSGQLKENYFSASTIVANLAHPQFDGFIEYDSPDDGSPINFSGISVFASGLRNPFGSVFHSNGNLYVTDNGPNQGYGKMKVGCSSSDILVDQEREDKLVHVIKNKYYGHPNPKRATYDNDPRQCVWRNPMEPTSQMFQAPLGVVLSSAVGMMEYQADHFNGQLRGNLIHVKYKKEVLRTVLSSDGLSANPLTIPGLKLLGRDGLDVAQAPNGNIVEVRYISNSIWISRPVETVTAAIRVSSVFPTRGSVAGGSTLRIYGLNFDTTATVKVGSSSCPIVGLVTTSYIQCTLPGRPVGLYDVVVTAVAGTYTFQKGYRYIRGF